MLNAHEGHRPCAASELRRLPQHLPCQEPTRRNRGALAAQPATGSSRCMSSLCARALGSGMLSVEVLSFGYMIVRLVLQLFTLVVRGERANEVENLVLRHQVAVL